MGDLNDELVTLEGKRTDVTKSISRLTKMKAKNPDMADDLDNLINKFTIKQKKLDKQIDVICEELTEIAEAEAAIYCDIEPTCDEAWF